MTALELPEPELHAIRLDRYERTVLGKSEVVESQIGRLALGMPILTHLNTKTVNAHAMPFLQARPGSRFHLLSLTASFTHNDDLPFKTAWVNVTLRCLAPDDAEHPVAWDMLPQTVTDEVSVSRMITLDSNLKFSFPAEIPGASATWAKQHQMTFKRQDVSLEALKEATSHPCWYFYTTNSAPIRGIHRLCLVIDIPATAHGTASIEIGATITMHHMKVFRFAAALDGTPELKTVQIKPT